MKFYLTLVLFIFLATISFSQTDSLKNLSQRQIEIEQSLENLQQGLENFQKQIAQKQNQIEVWRDSIKTINIQTSNDISKNNLVDSLEGLIQTNTNIIEALNKGVEDITLTIIELNDEIASLNSYQPSNNSDESTNNIVVPDISDDFNFKRRKKFRGHWFGFYLGVNSFVTNEYSLNLPEESLFMDVQLDRSKEFSLNPIQFSIPFFNRYVGLVTGFGFNFNSYELLQDVDLKTDSANVLYYEQFGFETIKNRFKNNTLTIPLVFEFHIPVNKKDKRLFLGAGLIGSYNLKNFMKIKYDNNGSLTKYKDNSANFILNKFNYHATLKAGYRNLYFYANYSFLPLFKLGYGPEIYPVSVGFGLSI